MLHSRQIQTTPIRLQFSFVTLWGPTVYNAKENLRKKIHLLRKLCKIQVAKFQFAFNFPLLIWVTYDSYNHRVTWRRSCFRHVVWLGSLLWNIEEGCKLQLTFTDKMTLFLAHTLFPKLLYLRNCLLFLEHTIKCTSFLTLLPQWREIMQKHFEFNAAIWSSEIASRFTFFNLKSCKWQMTIYGKATEEDNGNVCNKYVCYKPDALWPYWRSVGTFAIHDITCSYLLQNLGKRIKFCRNTCERCEWNVCEYSPALQWCCIERISRTGAVHFEQQVLGNKKSRVQITLRNRDNTFIRKFIAAV